MTYSSIIKSLYLLIIYFVFIPYAFSHDGTDELRTLEKNKQKIYSLQKKFKDIEKTQNRYENIESQLTLLQRNILILRNKMIEESPQIKSSMSKYDLNYMSEVEFMLKKMKRTLNNTKTVLND